MQESIPDPQESAEQVVGAPPKGLESDGSDVLKTPEDPLVKDISEYLLLHHNYSAKPSEENKNKTTNRTSQKNQRSKRRKVLPKLNSTTVQNELVSSTTNSLEKQPEVLYGTYDEKTNCITIIVDDDESLSNFSNTGDVILDDSNCLTVPKSDVSAGNASPLSCSGSDYGYESIGSPGSLGGNDIWDDSVSELFPSLM